MSAARGARWTHALRRMRTQALRVRDRVRYLYHRRTSALPARVGSVLVVCQGNICRSPFAEACLRALLAERGLTLEVRSAGLDTTPGKPAHPHTLAFAERRKLSLEAHATTRLEAALVDRSDLILVMEIAQKQQLQSLHPASHGKVMVLGHFDPDGVLEIADPYGKELGDFQRCFEQITRSCEALVQHLAR